MAIRRASELLPRTTVGRWVGFDYRVLFAVSDLIRIETGLQVTVLPWQGRVATILVPDPSAQRMLVMQRQLVLQQFDDIVGRGRIVHVRVRVESA